MQTKIHGNSQRRRVFRKQVMISIIECTWDMPTFSLKKFFFTTQKILGSFKLTKHFGIKFFFLLELGVYEQSSEYYGIMMQIWLALSLGSYIKGQVDIHKHSKAIKVSNLINLVIYKLPDKYIWCIKRIMYKCKWISALVSIDVTQNSC